MAGHVAFCEEVVRVLQTEAGRGAAQVTERFNADASPYLADATAPTGWAMVTHTTGDMDRVVNRHRWLVDELGR
jgi:hypothetical protein